MLKRLSLRGVLNSFVMSKRMSSESYPKDHLVWVDLEMTGLDVDNDHILEMACLITDKNLKIVATGPDIVIHQSDEVLSKMNDWCVEQHGKSGLTAAVRKSETSVEDAEDVMLDFVQQHVPAGCCQLAGNSIHVDKRFLDRHMERLMKHLHYRIVDVSSVKELCRRWFPEVRAPPKTSCHRAMDDIVESIKELDFYRKKIFKTSL